MLCCEAVQNMLTWRVFTDSQIRIIVTWAGYELTSS